MEQRTLNLLHTCPCMLGAHDLLTLICNGGQPRTPAQDVVVSETRTTPSLEVAYGQWADCPVEFDALPP
jgi:hypothetical protein